MNETFSKFSRKLGEILGKPITFFLACFSIVLWLFSYPFMDFVTWNFWANSSTTVLTFLFLFILQNTQNRDTKAIHIKLDDILLRLKEADTKIVDIEDKTEDEMRQIKKELIAEANQELDSVAKKVVKASKKTSKKPTKRKISKK